MKPGAGQGRARARSLCLRTSPRSFVIHFADLIAFHIMRNLGSSRALSSVALADLALAVAHLNQFNLDA
jgi:hypothetical protein